MTPLLTVVMRSPRDVVVARRRAREIAEALGLETLDQTRLATAVSEIARNAAHYAGGGRLEFLLDTAADALVVTVSDSGRGIPDLEAVLDGRTGAGGITASRRLVDRFSIESSASGTTVTLVKELGGAVPRGPVERIREELEGRPAESAVEEVERQNQALLSALERLERQSQELAALNAELEDTNRGVVALHAELEERADYLSRANEIKTRFLSHMTHEFRTPLNSILSLSRILLDRFDGELTGEQEKQVLLIRRSAEDLMELVNDLLDLAKVEAGKTVPSPTPSAVSELFGALRGVLRPLIATTAVQLVFDEPPEPIALETDVKKLSQILRNFVSNALKFTEHGEIRVTARSDGERVRFEVRDTGIGIAAEDQERIFEEFTQLESAQRAVKGTGLGLPLSRKLAGLLGGSIGVVSAPGAGSTFWAEVPLRYRASAVAPLAERAVDPGRVPVLVVEDGQGSAGLYERILEGTAYQPIPLSHALVTEALLQRLRPAAVILDVSRPDTDAWDLLETLKRRADAAPVLVVSIVDTERKAQALEADAFHPRPASKRWLRETLDALTSGRPAETVLVIDDDPAARYVLRTALAPRFRVSEAASGAEGLEWLGSWAPDLLFLDLKLGDMSGYDLYARIQADSRLGGMRVVIHTASPPEEVRQRLGPGVAILGKSSLTAGDADQALRSALETARPVEEVARAR